MEMIETDDIEEATHWMPVDDENIKQANLTENKIYEFVLNKVEGEWVIIDDKGVMSLAYLAINGKLFKYNK